MTSFVKKPFGVVCLFFFGWSCFFRSRPDGGSYLMTDFPITQVKIIFPLRPYSNCTVTMILAIDRYRTSAPLSALVLWRCICVYLQVAYKIICSFVWIQKLFARYAKYFFTSALIVILVSGYLFSFVIAVWRKFDVTVGGGGGAGEGGGGGRGREGGGLFFFLFCFFFPSFTTGIGLE